MERLLNKGTRSVGLPLIHAQNVALTHARCSGTGVILLKAREALLGIDIPELPQITARLQLVQYLPLQHTASSLHLAQYLPTISIIQAVHVDFGGNSHLSWRVASSRLSYRRSALQVEEDADADVKGTSATDADSSTSSQPESEGGKYAPKETFEDGSVMYAASDLEAVDYEAVLAP